MKKKIAIAAGDPAGIGPEVSIKAALDPAVRRACAPIVVGDAVVIERHAAASGIRAELRVVRHVAEADWSGKWLNVLDCPQPHGSRDSFGKPAAASGRAALAFAEAAIKAALSGSVDAVVAAPQNETAIALAGIKFDGYPSFVARATGTDASRVYLMLCFDAIRIVHCTFHHSVKDAIAMITREKVAHAIETTHHALRQMGVAHPRIALGGLNPHAGEGGLFGREEIDIIEPAINAAVAQGFAAAGPFPADTLLHRQGFDAFVVMLHDHGHMAAKLLARDRAAALTIGTPILFSSVAHGSVYDIAGKGLARPQAMIETLLLLARKS
jgi:4-hydroxythreonine-4-phosphate dehydrogenase